MPSGWAGLAASIVAGAGGVRGGQRQGSPRAVGTGAGQGQQQQQAPTIRTGVSQRAATTTSPRYAGGSSKQHPSISSSGSNAAPIGGGPQKQPSPGGDGLNGGAGTQQVTAQSAHYGAHHHQHQPHHHQAGWLAAQQGGNGTKKEKIPRTENHNAAAATAAATTMSGTAAIAPSQQQQQQAASSSHPRQREAGSQFARDVILPDDDALEVDLLANNTGRRVRTRPSHTRPLHLLSVQLIDTYKAINAAYYEKKAKRQQAEAAQQQQQQRQATVAQAATSASDVEAPPSTTTSSSTNNNNHLHQSNNHHHHHQHIHSTNNNSITAKQQQAAIPSSSSGSVMSTSTKGSKNHLHHHQHHHNEKAGVGPPSVSSASSMSTSTTASTAGGKGIYNNGWDDENYDYILEKEEILADRYLLKNRIGKGSFGQVVRGYDRVAQVEVAIKIIKSRKPFMMQAKTEIELLEHLKEKDRGDENNIVRLLDHFIHRGHQCLVFEMLSYNLYDLLKYTKFHGVSLTLLRKFAKQILKALQFLSLRDVDIIHCDLKPENILLRHPKRSGIKVIDFGSSCRSNKRMYSYIQSRFYRSPEVMMGLPYSAAIDMWSLGCVLVEMHTGEPLFGGVDQFDQMRRLVEVLGLPPSNMLDQSPAASRDIFFEQIMVNPHHPSHGGGAYRQASSVWRLKEAAVSGSGGGGGGHRLLSEIIGVSTGGPGGRRTGEAGHSYYHYSSFLDLVTKMLHYDPAVRVTPTEALRHPFLTDTDAQPVPRTISGTYESTAAHAASASSMGNAKEDALRSPRTAAALQLALDAGTQT